MITNYLYYYDYFYSYYHDYSYYSYSRNHMYTEVDRINLAIKKGFVESLSGFITVAVKDQAEESPPQLSMRISFAEILVLDISKGTRYLCLKVVIREPL